jgi:glycosyltransferase involved in cell wall biosynthesis
MSDTDTDATSAPPALADLLVINQVVGPLNRELLEDFARRGVRCRVLTGWVDAEEGAVSPFEVLRAKPLVKDPSWRRLWSWGVFTLQAVIAAIRFRRVPMLVATNPPWPMLLMPLLKWLAGVRYVLLVYDIYPDLMERMGYCRRGGLVGRLWRGMSRRSLLAAEGVITLGRHMADTLRAHLRPGDRLEIEVIPNWADTRFIRPVSKADNPFARQHGLVDKFVVAYSGALGATHDAESILSAAERLADLPDVHFLIIGGGTRWREVSEAVATRKLPNLTLLPFQPFRVLPYSLTAADVSIVCLDEGYEGLSVPSKTYYALAAGAAILAVSPDDTELTDLIAEHRCGLHVPPRSPQLLAQAVRRLHDDRELLARLRAAAVTVAGRFDRSLATAKYFAYLGRCFSPPAQRY